MSNAFQVSAVQFGARHLAVEENRRTVEAFVRAEAAHGSRLVVLPELAISGYCLDPQGLPACAEPADGPTAALLRGLSEKLGVVIVCGFCERGPAGELFNSAILVRPGGSDVIYRKLHLFDQEKKIFTPGDLGLVLAETDLGCIGICVCYDLRFVEVARGLSLAGADILAIPTAWVGGFDRVSHDASGYIGQARGALVQANLDQLPMICASQSGGDQGLRLLGSSLIADAHGTCVGGPMGRDDTGSLRATFDIAEIRAARVRSPLVRPREDRRTDVYGLTIGSRRL
ncbi:carbon-nitrogen hydrolase family protein [Defluviimonas sp. SAOS-178_SWC]|uniref:carbon-nitrogen hydrolase family protein n=1 Tax=Defluviimonas sp. SAOS-178_SWC TaxID=3121287 RepID=UPI003221D8F7